VWLKLVSFAHTSSDMRAIAKSIDKVNIPEKA
jgi:diacylglycerol O-acyltransferase-1